MALQGCYNGLQKQLQTAYHRCLTPPKSGVLLEEVLSISWTAKKTSAVEQRLDLVGTQPGSRLDDRWLHVGLEGPICCSSRLRSLLRLRALASKSATYSKTSPSLRARPGCLQACFAGSQANQGEVVRARACSIVASTKHQTHQRA